MSYRTGQQFPGNMDQLGHTHPIRVSGRYPREAGYALGHDMAGVIRLFDHVLMRDKRNLTAPLLMILGDFGSGKTTIGMRFLLHVFMMAVRGGLRSRVAADTNKLSGDIAEWTQFVEELGEKSIDLSSDFKNGINILDPKLPLRPQDHLRNISELMQDDGIGLDFKEKHILRTGLEHVLSLEERHVTDLNTWFVETSVEDYRAMVAAMKTLKKGAQPRVSEEELVAITNNLYFRLSNLINGEAGQVLGGRDSLADAMTGNVSSFNYTRLDPDAIAPVQSFIWRVRAAGVRYGDNSFFVDGELHDENYEAWDSMSYALAMRGRTKKLRGTGSLLIFVSQHITDYLAIAGPQGEIARNMLRDVGMWMIAQHDVEDLPYIREHCGITKEVSEVIPMLRVGEFLVKIGPLPPFTIQYPLTELLKKISDTDIATRRNLEVV